MRTRRTILLLATLVVAIAAATARADQMFKPNPGGAGLSVTIVAPRSGAAALPAGWTADAKPGHANCQLAHETLAPSSGAGVLTTTSYDLPRGDYEVALCCIGSGKARLKGAAEWVDVGGHADSYYRWTPLGTVKNATRVSVEVAGEGRSFRYAGLSAEGSRLPIIPVEKVVEKLRAKQPVTVCLMGDSVQEDAKGFRGGSSDFDHGVNGLLKAALEKEFGGEVSYVSHREPPGWPDDGSIDRLKEMGKVIELDGKAYRDGRVPFDASKPIRLVNMAKGGAASPDGWMRLPQTFTEAGDWRGGGRRWTDTADAKLPPILRIGVAGYKPDLVFINFGTNDANGSHKGWTAEDYLWNMKVLVTMIQRDLGAAVVVTTPHLWTRGTHQQPHTQPEMADAIRAYARASGVRLADVYNEYERGQYDGIHPGDTGHKHLADAYMKALLGKPSEPQTTALITAADLKAGDDGTVTDAKSGLMWTRDANPFGEPKTQAEAEALIATMNAEKQFGHDDWRLPTRDELLSLADPAERPALPRGHPFRNVQRYYLSTTLEMKRNFCVDFQLGGIGYWPASMDSQRGWIWPVRAAK